MKRSEGNRGGSVRRLACLMGLCLLAVPGLVAQPGRNNRVDVIIGFNHQPGPSEQALVRAFGGIIRHTYRIIPAIAASLPAQAVGALQNNPAVSVIEPDVEVHALDEYSSAWGVQKIGAQTVHGANRGAGFKVCVIDSGVDWNHPDLAGNYIGGYDFVNGDNDPWDDNGHGTHVAGTVAAQLNGFGAVGVAPESGILAYKILNASGSGSFSNAIAAVDRCLADGGHVTNNSYGASSDPGSLTKAAFDNAYNGTNPYNRRVLHVAAAGNATVFTCNSVSYPARYDSVIAVGATDSGDNVASWSCRGPEVELSAPGVSITSTYPDDIYASGSGTSMASPHVAGTAALVFGCGLLDQNSDGVVNNVDVRLRMQQTALDLGTAGRDSSYGFGRVRADQAATNCSVAPPPATPPDPPSNLRVTGVGPNYVSLAWNDNSNNENTFEVWRCTGSTCTNFARVATLSANTASYRNSGLSRRTTYRFEVRAVNTAGPSAFSNIVSATTK